MTRRTPGHERLRFGSSQVSTLSSALAAVLDCGPEAVPAAAGCPSAPSRRLRPAPPIVVAEPIAQPDTPEPTRGAPNETENPNTANPSSGPNDPNHRPDGGVPNEGGAAGDRVDPTDRGDRADPPDGLDRTDRADGLDRAESADRADRDGRVDVATLWGPAGGPRDRGARDRLLEHYAPLVRAVAGRMAAGLPTSVETADLVQAGVFGLLDAIARYDPARCIRFETYAAQRIRGAMLDELRAQDWVPRSVRGRVREVDRARERLEIVLQRAPSPAELAGELGVTVRELRRIAQHRRLVSVEALTDTPGRMPVADSLPDETAPDPVALVQLQETRRHLVDAVRRLGERDRLVVHLYYVENRTLAEIGALLGVTESRVCQLHTRLVGRLRGRMEELVAG